MMGGDGGGGNPMSGWLGFPRGHVEMEGPTPTHHQQQGMGMGVLGRGGELIRLPQWSQQETRDLISARAELERDSGGGAAKRRSNKNLWEEVAAKMRERGHVRRTPEQCKCKWKNLVNRYKGKETADPESERQCPFFEELHAVFTERARNMQRRLLQEMEPGASLSRKKKRLGGDDSSDEFSEEEDDEDSDGGEHPTRSKKKKKVVDGQKAADKSKMGNASSSSIRDVVQEFFTQLQHMELQWHETMERRAQERLRFDQEWRQSMEKLERERLTLEQAWREREEQRRMREESRAEKRDALLTTLLNQLTREEGLQ